jgi:thiol-disulfide isomerase/thioredoxin
MIRSSRCLALTLWLLAPASLGVCAAADAGAQPMFASSRAWLGVSTSPGPGRSGVQIGHVVRGSPADRAGLREGDRLVSVAALRMGRAEDVSRAVGQHSIGDTIEIGFVRGQAEQTVRAVLAAFPSQDEMMRMDLVGAFAPAWRDVESVNGSFPTSVGALRGRVVLLDFWATWCGPCRIVMRTLGSLHARYGAQGLSVLGVSTEESEDVALYVHRAAVPYAVAVDKHAETTRSYGVFSLPTLVIIDKRGVVRDVAIGYDPSGEGQLESTVRALLAEPPPG